MAYELVKISNNKNKIYWTILILSFCVFIFVTFIFKDSENFDNKSKDINKNKNKNKYIEPLLSSYNIGTCSKNCCATQWPTPVDVTERSGVNMKDVGPGRKFTASNLTCNNGVKDTGCVCLTDGTRKLLGNRGYVKDLPKGNGLLNQDYRKSAFKIMEDKVQPAKVLGQTEELTGKKTDIIYISGKNENKFDNKVDKYRTIAEAKELEKNYSMPINTNMITIDNDLINHALFNSNISGNELSDLETLLNQRLGLNTQNVFVDRK